MRCHSVFRSVLIRTLMGAIAGALTFSPQPLIGQTAKNKLTDGVSLRWKLYEGETLAIEMKQNLNQNVQFDQKEAKTTTTTSTWMTWTVDKVDSVGNADVSSTIDRVTLEMNGPGAKIKVDTNEKEDAAGAAAQMGAIFRPMVGVKFKQKMNPRGEISDVQVPEEAVAGLKGTAMGGSPIDMIKDMTSKASPVFPEAPMQIGTSWKQNSSTKSPVGDVKVENTYTYKGTTTFEDRNVHQIDVAMVMSYGEGDNPLVAKVEVVDQDTQGVLYFDERAGHLCGSKVHQKMTLSIVAAGKEFTQQLDQQIDASFRKKK